MGNLSGDGGSSATLVFSRVSAGSGGGKGSARNRLISSSVPSYLKVDAGVGEEVPTFLFRRGVAGRLNGDCGSSAGVTVPPLPSCPPNRVARDPAGFAPPPLPSCSPNRVARDPARLEPKRRDTRYDCWSQIGEILDMLYGHLIICLLYTSPSPRD